MITNTTPTQVQVGDLKLWRISGSDDERYWYAAKTEDDAKRLFAEDQKDLDEDDAVKVEAIAPEARDLSVHDEDTDLTFSASQLMAELDGEGFIATTQR